MVMSRGLRLPIVLLALLVGVGTAAAVVACGSDDAQLLGDGSLDAAAPDAASPGSRNGATDAGAVADAAISPSDPVPTSCTCVSPLSSSRGAGISASYPCGVALCVGLPSNGYSVTEWKCFDAGSADYVSPPVDCKDAGFGYGDAG